METGFDPSTAKPSAGRITIKTGGATVATLNVTGEPAVVRVGPGQYEVAGTIDGSAAICQTVTTQVVQDKTTKVAIFCA